MCCVLTPSAVDGETGAYLDDFIPAGSGGPEGTGTIDQPAGLLFAKLEAESSEQAINAGMNGAWASLDMLGQGMFFDAVESTHQFFLGWFTYEADSGLESVADGNTLRWMVGLGPYEGSKAVLELSAVEGGAFNKPDPVNTIRVGTATIRFISCTEAWFEYELDNGMSGAFKLNRLLPDALCEDLSIKGAKSNE
jgi:hypothetical protein